MAGGKCGYINVGHEGIGDEVILPFPLQLDDVVDGYMKIFDDLCSVNEEGVKFI
jgi:hypothetical protein